MISIIFEDEDLLIVEKRAGMPVQTGRIGQLDLESQVRNYLSERSGSYNPYVAVINRLDQPVAGIVIFAKSEMAAKSMSLQMTENSIKKEYLAIVSARQEIIEKYSGKVITLTDYLLKVPRGNMARVVKDGLRGAKKSVLHMEVLRDYSDYKKVIGVKKAELLKESEVFLIKIQLETGRFHQIRAQLSNIEMPIIGDVKYGGMQDTTRLNRGEIGLIAYKIEFSHPISGERMMFQILDK